ncbi:MAG: hypothetical protein IKZ94_02475, partial [Lachnospiraceae bacterium]|nr:hypothetical protein [Lachnospiraceae bacterium]
MKNSTRKVITGIFAAAAITGLVSIASAADTYTDSNDDEFTYEKSGAGIQITKVKDDGDGKVVVPAKIENIEISHIDIRDIGLSGLDVSKCTNISYLDCSGNQLTSLDLSNNTELIHVDCSNNKLTNLDFSN